jgi:glycosyltransferase involved in cell wall biosynthesis
MSERPIRVLHLLNSFSHWGCGIVNAALDILSGQMQEGLDVAVCSGSGELIGTLERHGIPHFTLDQSRSMRNLARAAISLRRIIRSFEPDVVHCHMMTGVLLARAVRLTARYGLVAHVHNVHQRSSVMMGAADRVIAVSDAVRADMRKHGVPARKLRVVRNGTLGSIRFQASWEDAAKQLLQPAIVSVGGLNHRKGIRELIIAFEVVCREIAGCNLYLVGSGPNRGEFELQATRSPFSAQIHFENFQANPLPYMRAASVYVLASRRESFGLVLTEARQCGCAIVATNVDGIPEALDGGRAGLLVPPENPEALASGILQVLRRPDLRAQLRARATENLAQFRVERVASEITEVYRELLGRPRPEFAGHAASPSSEARIGHLARTTD